MNQKKKGSFPTLNVGFDTRRMIKITSRNSKWITSRLVNVKIHYLHSIFRLTKLIHVIILFPIEKMCSGKNQVVRKALFSNSVDGHLHWLAVIFSRLDALYLSARVIKIVEIIDRVHIIRLQDKQFLSTKKSFSYLHRHQKSM